MANDYELGDDDLGDDELILSGDDDVGARRRRPRGRAPTPNALAIQRRNRARSLAADQPDQGGVALDQIMPFTGGVFTALVPVLRLVATPQKRFQLKRLVVDLGRAGATAAGPLVQATDLSVGADRQFTQSGNVPVSMFSSVAVGIFLKGNAARPGITVTLDLVVSAGLVAPDTITVSAAGVGPVLA